MFKKKSSKLNINDDKFVDLEEYTEDEDVEAEILGFMNLEKPTNEVEPINENVKKQKKEKKKIFKHRNKKDDDFIDVGEPTSYQTNFVIVGDNKNKFGNITSIIKIISGIFLFICATLIVTGCMLYKIIPGNIVGANYHIASLSIISRDYRPNLDELSPGDKIICADKSFDFLPFVLKSETYKFESNNGPFSIANDKNGNTTKIQSTDINYIIKQH